MSLSERNGERSKQFGGAMQRGQKAKDRERREGRGRHIEADRKIKTYSECQKNKWTNRHIQINRLTEIDRYTDR